MTKKEKLKLYLFKTIFYASKTCNVNFTRYTWKHCEFLVSVWEALPQTAGHSRGSKHISCLCIICCYKPKKPLWNYEMKPTQTFQKLKATLSWLFRESILIAPHIKAFTTDIKMFTAWNKKLFGSFLLSLRLHRKWQLRHLNYIRA